MQLMDDKTNKIYRNIINEWILKILIPASISILLFALLIFGYMIPKTRTIILDEKKTALKNIVYCTCSLINSYYDQAQKGILTTQEAQDRVLMRIKNIKYGKENKDYLWIHTIDGKMITHPYVEMHNKNILNYKDAKGQNVFRNMNTIAQKDGEGFINYYWQWKDQPERIAPKLSFVRFFEPWGWIIGSGIYTEDVRIEINTLTQKMLKMCILISSVLFALSIAITAHSLIIARKKQKAEEDFIEIEKKFRHIVEKSPFPLIQIGDKDNIEYINPKVTEVLGYVLEEIPDMAVFLGKLFPDKEEIDNILRMWKEDSANIDLNNYFTRVFNVNSANNDLKKIIFRLIKLQGNKKILFMEDVTERDKAQKRIARQTKELKKSNIELEQYAFIASHDMQEPLRIISTYLQMLEKDHKGKLDKQGIKFLERSIFYANRMRFLMRDLLTFSRIRKNIIKKELVNMQYVMDSALKKIDYLIRESTAVIKYNTLPEIMASPVFMEQLMINLITNSIKFKSDKPPEINIYVEKRENSWQFSITDNGIGIDPKFAKRVFRMFERLNPASNYTSTGIGLAVAKKIIESYGGKIWVVSEPGKGSTFKFTIPTL